ncbi:hypothetical protein AMAG_14807 [Allomyces macrogynus ATCC 38327]|uniref:Uncharacterized protein n=1 Tax=Allomyces macrogynus (strain ATCC 38327) TaxID=578462 RepID=A0A0L0T612_ALLM3|nr:hypothetical protein AMAG_14807 [Allomyces macrogynus ATCC 38327]|eukprot:KNE69969.1 hypothetical protein AMAG_14807 [Allomyces macrogynus ATCC 38327]
MPTDEHDERDAHAPVDPDTDDLDADTTIMPVHTHDDDEPATASAMDSLVQHDEAHAHEHEHATAATIARPASAVSAHLAAQYGDDDDGDDAVCAAVPPAAVDDEDPLPTTHADAHRGDHVLHHDDAHDSDSDHTATTPTSRGITPSLTPAALSLLPSALPSPSSHASSGASSPAASPFLHKAGSAPTGLRPPVDYSPLASRLAATKMTLATTTPPAPPAFEPVLVEVAKTAVERTERTRKPSVPRKAPGSPAAAPAKAVVEEPKPRARTPKPAVVVPPPVVRAAAPLDARPEWNSTINELDKFGLTPEELHKRKQMMAPAPGQYKLATIRPELANKAKSDTASETSGKARRASDGDERSSRRRTTEPAPEYGPGNTAKRIAARQAQKNAAAGTGKCELPPKQAKKLYQALAFARATVQGDSPTAEAEYNADHGASIEQLMDMMATTMTHMAKRMQEMAADLEHERTRRVTLEQKVEDLHSHLDVEAPLRTPTAPASFEDQIPPALEGGSDHRHVVDHLGVE